MIVKKLDVHQVITVQNSWKFAIYYTDTTTGIPNVITCTNVSGGNLSGDGFADYFLANAIYNTSNFTAVKTGIKRFSFQSNFSNIVITGYKGFNAIGSELFSGFTFDITDVTIADLPPIPPSLPVNVRTSIDAADKITFCNSPIFIRIDATILTKSLAVNLYIWDGKLNKIISLPTHQLIKEKVSANDEYISIEISDLIRPYIKPNFAYNRASAPAVTNQGVFWQAQLITTDTDGIQSEVFSYTYFCTLGYRWNYEQNIVANNGIQNYGANGFVTTVNKWYNPKIHDYFYYDFDFTKTVANGKTSNIVKYNEATIPLNWKRCTQDPTLIVFINKLGLWETFTPHGKFIANTAVKRTDTNISHRDPSRVDNTYTHSRLNNSLEVLQSYVVNSGSLTEDMDSIIEELIYSPKVYLINFLGDFELVTTIGITIDSTYITIDSTLITIDSQIVTGEYLGMYKTHQQIPVIMTDEDFTRKTRLNNKLEIDYNIKFAETNNKINQIR